MQPATTANPHRVSLATQRHESTAVSLAMSRCLGTEYSGECDSIGPVMSDSQPGYRDSHRLASELFSGPAPEERWNGGTVGRRKRSLAKREARARYAALDPASYTHEGSIGQ